MKLFKLAFASLWSAIPLAFLYILACAVATFIENDYGTAVARSLIYNTPWFEFLHLYLLVSLIGCLLTFRTLQRKRYAIFCLHLSFIVILVGAGMTRYFGFEGIMHIREGETSNSILSSETYLNITARQGKQQETLHVPAHLIAGQTLHKEITILQNPLKISMDGIQKLSSDKKNPTSKMSVTLHSQGIDKQVDLIGGIGIEGKPQALQIGDQTFILSWGTRRITLPFAIALKDFQLDRYPGSMSPSSYASEVEVIDEDNQINQPFRIFMNNVLDYQSYRFFQSSYDTDEQGTILSVNNDPGKNMTYLGYALLTLGCIWLLFDSKGRFRRLGAFLKSQQVLSLALFITTSLYPAFAQQDAKTQAAVSKILDFQSNSQDFSQTFGALLVQDYGGRVKPINTLATDMVHKITKTDDFAGFSNTQLFLGMIMLPEEFQKFKMIKISNPELRSLLGVQGNHLAFQDVFTQDQIYILQNYVEEANRKKPAERNVFDKDVIALDERINLAYVIYTGEVLKIFPSIANPDVWNQPIQAIRSALLQNRQDEARQIGKILQKYASGFEQGISNNQWEQAIDAINTIKAYQQEHSPSLIPGSTKIKLEIFLNQNNFFKQLILPYILSGALLLGIILLFIFKNQSLPTKWTRIFYAILALLASVMTLALALRWYVGGHAPWSNAYESMIYISWASSISALIFFRKSNLAISASLFLTGICLFVANLGFMDPQITNLVPVLKSYWLNIHVSIITASYGFLGLCFILGLITLVMFILRNTKSPQVDQSILSLTAINEMSMIIGLFMLTIGTFLGGIWANESWGRYWGWDAKETWSLISIGVYGIILHWRFLGFKNMPYLFACLSSVGFFSILMTYFGVNYYLSGMHSYAAGDPFPIPTFVYFLITAIALLIMLGFPKRNLIFPALKSCDKRSLQSNGV